MSEASIRSHQESVTVEASVDPPGPQLAMNETWHLPFGWVSDPGGAQYARPLDAWNDDAGSFTPIVVALAPDGREVFRELSRDFTDRPDDEPIIWALEALHLSPRRSGSWRPAGVEAHPSERAFKPASFIPYLRAIKVNTLALADRMVDHRDREQVLTEHRMANSSLETIDRWRERWQ